MLLEFECNKVEAGEGSEALMKGFAIKASMSEMISLGDRGEKTIGVKVFLIEDEVVSVDGFGGIARVT